MKVNAVKLQHDLNYTVQSRKKWVLNVNTRRCPRNSCVSSYCIDFSWSAMGSRSANMIVHDQERPRTLLYLLGICIDPGGDRQQI